MHVLLFFSNDTPTTDIYILSLHDALPIWFVIEGSRAFGVAYLYANLLGNEAGRVIYDGGGLIASNSELVARGRRFRSEEHTSELQSQFHLVCRLLLEKKK